MIADVFDLRSIPRSSHRLFWRGMKHAIGSDPLRDRYRGRRVRSDPQMGGGGRRVYVGGISLIFSCNVLVLMPCPAIALNTDKQPQKLPRFFDLIKDAAADSTWSTWNKKKLPDQSRYKMAASLDDHRKRFFISCVLIQNSRPERCSPTKTKMGNVINRQLLLYCLGAYI
jgi:hypothetical protein